MKNDETTNFKNEQGTGDSSGNGSMSENTRVRLAARNAKAEGVQKGVLTTALISLAILIIAAVIVFTTHKKEKETQLALMQSQQQAFTQTLTSRDSVINEWMTTFDEIEKNLSMVKQKENIITIQSSGGEISKNKKDQIMKDIEYINALLDQNKQKISSLNAQLKKSGGVIKGLETKIAELEASVKQSETEIATLKSTLVEKDFQIGQLSTKVSDQELAIAQKDEKISTQTQEINKAFYTTGTFKELKAKGLVTKEGGFIGLGRKAAITGSLPETSFTRIDVTQLKSIPVNSKTAKLLTDHPANSYEFVLDKDKKVISLDIKDPAEFWRLSKYAVVQVK
jgi:hypothetical protein